MGKIHWKAKKICKQADVEFVGVAKMGDIYLVYFNDKSNKTTLIIKAEDLSVDNVKSILTKSKEQWSK